MKNQRAIVSSLFESEPDGATPGYIAMRNRSNPNAIVAREHCDDLWRDYAPCADTNFSSDFPLRTHDRWFEMYLTVALMRAGLDVQCPKPPGPDVLLTIDGRRIWIEATCASAGAPGLPDSVPEPAVTIGGAGVVTERPTDTLTLRIRNALHEKEKKFRSYIERGIVGAGDVTAVAINIHAIPHASLDMDDVMRRALYGLGHLTLTIDRDTKAIVDRGYQLRPLICKRSTKAPVEVDPFVSGSMGHISAVIGSRENPANRPPRLGDGFVVYPNIGAANAWPAGAIELGQEWLIKHVHDDVELESVSYIA